MKGLLSALFVCLFLVLAYTQYQPLITSCGPFNTFDPRLGYDLPEGYTDLTSMFPGLYLDEEGRIVLPCNLSYVSQGGSTSNTTTPIILTVSSSVYGTPVCALAVDCADTGVGNITLSATNTRTNQTVSFVALELCSQPGVFFGCVDTAFIANNTNAPTFTEPTLTGRFGDQFNVSYNTVNGGVSSNVYPVYISCSSGAVGGYPYQQISSLLLQDAYNRTISKLNSIRSRLIAVQTLLFNNNEGVPCEEIGQAADLSQTALDFFNFLECIGNRELSENAFLDNLASLKPREQGSSSYCALGTNGTTSVIFAA